MQIVCLTFPKQLENCLLAGLDLLFSSDVQLSAACRNIAIARKFMHTSIVLSGKYKAASPQAAVSCHLVDLNFLCT